MINIDYNIWGTNLIVIYTPSYTYAGYLKAINKLYNSKLLKRLYKRKITIQVVLKNEFNINLVYYDGSIYKRYNKISENKIIHDIDNMLDRKIRSFV